jgi:hypothetical protein
VHHKSEHLAVQRRLRDIAAHHVSQVSGIAYSGEHNCVICVVRTQAEGMLYRVFERVEGYEAESLTDVEIARLVSEVLPEVPGSPASEQFLGGLLVPAGNLRVASAQQWRELSALLLPQCEQDFDGVICLEQQLRRMMMASDDSMRLRCDPLG